MPRSSAASSRSTSASPAVEDTVAILRGLKERYEAHHKVAIADAALVAAASLSNRYIPSRQLPDKAIDLIDEAASRLRMEIDSAPLEIDELRRHVDRLKLEELALKKREGRRLEGAPRHAARDARGGAGSSSTSCRRAGSASARRSTASATSRPSSTPPAWRPSARSARATSRRRRGCCTPRSRRSSGSSSTPSAKSPRATAWSTTRSPTRTSPPSSRRGPASRSAGCCRARPRSCCTSRPSSASA